MIDRIVRKSEAARLLGVSATSRWRLETAGEIRPVKILPGVFGFRESELQRFIASRERATPDRSRVAAALRSRGIEPKATDDAEVADERL